MFFLIVFFRPGNMDLMSGISTELRDENAEGIYTTTFPPFTVTSLPHAHVDSAAAPPANQILLHLQYQSA